LFNLQTFINNYLFLFIMSNVYFVKNQEDLSKFFDLIKLEGKVGVKTHFGEPGNKTFPNPKIVELFCNKVNGTLIETNVLYKAKN